LTQQSPKTGAVKLQSDRFEKKEEPSAERVSAVQLLTLFFFRL
jgi:hypothetical protein